mmetsp:Transcript_31126/g.73996  ORF Transcript_31126/g.73996 Transcript_31126/m.73996 type:complete len:136 (-) Transcript_31126:84-491(-)
MSDGEPCQVLSVDDDTVNQMVIERVVKKGGFRLSKAPSAEDALDILAELHKNSGVNSFPAVILMDLNLPGLSGFEAAKKIREMYPGARVTILITTADQSQETVDRCQTDGCDGHVGKPLKTAQLLERIKSVVEGS